MQIFPPSHHCSICGRRNLKEAQEKISFDSSSSFFLQWTSVVCWVIPHHWRFSTFSDERTKVSYLKIITGFHWPRMPNLDKIPNSSLSRETHVWILSWLCQVFSPNSSLTWWNLVQVRLSWPALISFSRWHSPKPFAVRKPLILCGVLENSSSPATFCYLHDQ